MDYRNNLKKFLVSSIVFFLFFPISFSINTGHNAEAGSLFENNNLLQINDDHEIIESFDFKIRDYPDGSWQDTPLYAEVGSIIEFKIEIEFKSNGYLTAGFGLPSPDEDPMFDFIEGSQSPKTNDDIKLVYFEADNTLVNWIWAGLYSSWSETMTFRAEIVRSASGSVSAAAGAGRVLPPASDYIEEQFIFVSSEDEDEPVLSYNPQSWDFGNVVKGESKTTSFDIWNAGSGVLTYSLFESCDWVTLDSVGGSSSGEIDTIGVTVDTSLLTDDQDHYCDIEIITDVGNAVFTVHVYVSDGLEGPILMFDPTSYDFGEVVKGSFRTTSFDIWNAGSGVLTYSLFESCDWVTLDSVGGSSSGEIDTIGVTVDTSLLNTGNVYYCDILISSNAGDAVFSINLEIVGDQPILYFNPENYDFGDLDEGMIYETSFQIHNYGTEQLSFSLNWDCPWITYVDPDIGLLGPEQYETINIGVDTTDLIAGTHHSCDVEIDSNDRTDYFTLEFDIFDPNQPQLEITPESLVFGNMQTGETMTKTFEIQNTGGGNLEYELSENSNWITSIAPAIGKIESGQSTEISVTIDTNTLSPGPHSASIYISSSSFQDIVYNVYVNIVGEESEVAIQVDKKIFDSNTNKWVDNIDAYCGQVLKFRCEIANPNSASRIFYIRAGDILPNNLEYVDGSFSIASNVNYEIDLVDTIFFYYFREPIFPGEKIIIRYEAKALSPGNVKNIFKAQGMIDRVTSNLDDEEIERIQSQRGGPVEISIHDVFVSDAESVLINVYGDDEPPEIPINPYPQTGSKNLDLSFVFSWESNNLDMTYYDLILEANDASPTQKIASGITNDYYNIESLKSNTHYYWKVIAKDDDGTTEGPVWEFWTKSDSDILSISYPDIGTFQYKGFVYNSKILSFLDRVIVFNSSLHISTEVSEDIEKVKFIATKHRTGDKIENWDNTSFNGFKTDLDLAFGKYKITVKAYKGDTMISSVSLKKVIFVPL